MYGVHTRPGGGGGWAGGGIGVWGCRGYVPGLGGGPSVAARGINSTSTIFM